MSKIDKKIIEEIKRYQSINNYILEQDISLPPAPGDEAPPTPAAGGITPPPPAAGATPPPAGEGPQPVDVATDPDVEKIDSEGKSEETEGGSSDTEELDITDLVTAQKDSNEKQDNYFKDLFGQIERLESKLGEMDNLVNKINSLEQKIEKYRPKTPQEKLELRSLDSGPYNQKLSDFFIDKEQDIRKSGKNEYVLTSDEVENFTPSDIKTSFNPEEPKNFGI
jgi:hypothetical protein